MLDKVLAFEPLPNPRKRPNTNSQTSSNNGPYGNSSQSFPDNPPNQKLYDQEIIENQESQQDKKNLHPNIFSKHSNKKVKPQKGTESEEEISSPAINNIKMAKVPLRPQDMKNSTKIYLQQSAKHLQGSETEKKSNDDFSYKIKMLIFLIVSILLTLNAMTPTRKITYIRK